MNNFLRWFLIRDEELRLPKSWLNNVARLQEYEDWTHRELESAYVSKNTAWFQRKEFWKRVQAQPVKTSAKVLSGRFS